MVTIPSGYGQLTLVHTGAGVVGEAVWTQGFQNAGADDATTIGDAFKGFLVASDYFDRLSTTCTVTEIRVKLGPSATGESAVVSVGNEGTIGGQPVSPNVACLIVKNTALGGRHGRGRLFIPCLAAAALDDSAHFDQIHADGIASDLQGIWAAMLLGGQAPVLLHSDAVTPTPLTSFAGISRIATQRRRNRR